MEDSSSEDWIPPDIEGGFTSYDIAYLENLTKESIEKGCKECGFKYIIFSTNVSHEPSGTKVFFLDVECAKCDTEYRDIMGVRN